MILDRPLFYIEEDEERRPPVQYVYHFEEPEIWTRERFIESLLKQNEEVAKLHETIKGLGREKSDMQKRCNCKTKHKPIDASIDYE